MLKIIFAVSLVSLGSPAFAESIKDVDNFQGRIDKCIVGKKPDKCLNNLLSSHLPPGNEAMREKVPKVVNLLVQWLKGDSVYAIHPIKSKKVGDIVDIRYSAIESNATGFMVMRVTYLKILGEPYLFGFNLSNKDETINALLSGDL